MNVFVCVCAFKMHAIIISTFCVMCVFANKLYSKNTKYTELNHQFKMLFSAINGVLK